MTKRRPGRPPSHNKTEQSCAEARTLASVGVPHHQAAQIMGISTETLLKYYANELADGKARASFQVARTLFSQAVGQKDAEGNWITPPHLGALIYWTKSQMGWRETHVVQSQQLGADGKPIDPPRLGISFEDGGPGRARRVPFNQETDEQIIKSLPVGADKLN